MIRSLRSRHRWMITLLAPLLAVLFVASLRARLPVPIEAELPAVLAATAQGEALEVAFLSTDTSGVEGALVYWLPEAPAKRGEGLRALPSGATLLGALDGSGRGRFRRPNADRAGAVLLYDLGAQAIVATAAVEIERT